MLKELNLLATCNKRLLLKLARYISNSYFIYGTKTHNAKNRYIVV